MDSPSIAISINLKIKDKEVTLSMEEAQDLYSQLRSVLGYNNQPYTVPYPWGTLYPYPYINYTLNCSDNTNSNWKII
jgi:hypothetical protein